MPEATIESDIAAYAKRKKREDDRRYREKNHEIIKLKNREWARRHRAEIRADPEKLEEFKAQSRQYYQNHKDKYREYYRQYYQDHKGKVKARQKKYYEEHKDELIAYQHEYRRRKREREHDNICNKENDRY